MKKLNITREEIEEALAYIIQLWPPDKYGEDSRCEVIYNLLKKVQSNFELIADAGNEYQKTGMLPSEMYEKISTLRAQAKLCEEMRIDFKQQIEEL